MTGDFNRHASHIVQAIIRDLFNGGKRYKPIERLPPRLAVFYNPETDDFDGTLPSRNRFIYMTEDGLMIKMCLYSCQAPRIWHNKLVYYKTIMGPHDATPVRRKLFQRE